MSLTEPPLLSVSTRSPLDRWALDPHVVHLNHGSYGGCLKSVVAQAARWRERIEAAPMKFFVLDWQAKLDSARAALAAFVNAPAERTVFVPGATTGIAIALHSIAWSPGDQIVIADHGYRAVTNQVERLAAQHGLGIVTVPIALPFDPDQITDAFTRAVTDKTIAVIVDHVTSPTALRLPVERIVAALPDVVTIVDGAHAPGQLPLDVTRIGATYYTGNCHKWLCAPKGSGFLVVRHDATAMPIVTSHGASADYGPPNRLHAELDWAGTHDPAVHLTVPTAIDHTGKEGDGWPAILARNHALVVEMRRRFCDALARGQRVTPIAADDHLGSMAAIPITIPGEALALEKQLLEAGWEVPIVSIDTSGPKGALVRLSAHLYNHAGEAEDLARELRDRGVALR